MFNKKSMVASIYILIFSIFFSVLPNSLFNTASANDATGIIITEVYYDTRIAYSPDEYVAISNPLGQAVDISGWQIGDDGTKAVFPNNTSIASGETLYVVREADVVIQQNTLSLNNTPDFEFSDNTVTTVPNMDGDDPRFVNGGDDVLLKDDVGNIIDVVVYGTGSYDGIGWSGDTVPTGSSGDIIVRNKNESTGNWIDTDTRSDWDSLKTDPTGLSDELRTYKQAQSRFEIESFQINGNVTPYTSPDSTYEVLEGLITNAESSIEISIYEMTSPHLTDLLVDAIDSGVQVRAHFDGSPVGGLQDDSRWVSQQITEAGGEVRYLIHDPDEDVYKRYRWDHSKYGIIDDEILFVQSENWKKTGTPVDNSSGNRGWGVVIEDEDVSSYYQEVFLKDWDDSFPDTFAHTPSHEQYGNPPSDFEPDYETPTGEYPAPFAGDNTITGEFTITPVIAPDTSFLDESIVGMIASAENYVYVDHMTFHKFWGAQDDSPETHPNIYLEAAIEAARDGVKVRMSLGDAWLDSDNARDNTHTIDYVNDIAAAENLDMEAQLIDSTSIGVRILHNKGFIADDKVLLSSINGSKNSGKNNREAAVIVQNQDVADFYKEVFEYDWIGGEDVIGDAWEDFESGSKGTYAEGDVDLASGSWNFDNALLGSLDNDKKFNEQSARIRSEGSISMNFDIPGVDSISFYHANYGFDDGAEITVQQSTDGGVNWTDIQGSFSSQNDLSKVTYNVNESGDVRFKIIATGVSGDRINIDNFDYVEAGATEESILYEDFEGNTKGSYAAGDVNLDSGSWHFDNALLGAHSSDKKFGDRSARIRSVGSINMNFDVASASSVSFYHANFGSDTGGEITLQKSTDQGSSWTDVEGPFTSQNLLEKKTIAVNETGNVRFRILVTGSSGKRINIDNLNIYE